jgi:hypothetical protein
MWENQRYDCTFSSWEGHSSRGEMFHPLYAAVRFPLRLNSLYMLMLKFNMTLPVGLIHWSAVLVRAWKPNWFALGWSLSSMCIRIIFRITFSNSLPVVNRRLIVRKLYGNLGFLPGCDNVITFASFNGCVHAVNSAKNSFQSRLSRKFALFSSALLTIEVSELLPNLDSVHLASF